jgi:hypothetical protein
MSGAGRLTRTVLVVVFGGVTVAWLAHFFALFGCSWEGCSTRDHVTFYVLLAAGAVGIGARRQGDLAQTSLGSRRMSP